MTLRHFHNIRIFPSHGTRSAAITWSMASHAPAGNVYVARSDSGVDGSWQCLNETTPVLSSLGLYTDTTFDINSGSAQVYYRLLLVSPGHEDSFSDSVTILNLLSPAEVGIVRGMLHRLYHIFRSRNGYPMWWCVPLSAGEMSPRKDPDTGEVLGIECDGTPLDQSDFGTEYVGGFHDPILTWVLPKQVRRYDKRDADDETKVTEDDGLDITTLAWPIPSRAHMLVEPVTDRRYLIADPVTPNMLRGIYPVTFDLKLELIPPSDNRYRVVMPEFDMKAYRRL